MILTLSALVFILIPSGWGNVPFSAILQGRNTAARCRRPTIVFISVQIIIRMYNLVLQRPILISSPGWEKNFEV